ncbi:MAG TPA: LytR family transcriptional regulator [Firmicutes bacterium]|nr:LytR family transcriptional regulator [Bacillota bacterium]
MVELTARSRFYISLVIIILIIVLSFTVIFYGVYQVYYAPASLFRRNHSAFGTVEEEFDNKVLNVAVLGLHNRNEDNTFGEIYYVDTIMIASVSFEQNSLNLLAVPRDSYVEIAGEGVEDRIRQSYSYGYNRALEAGEEKEERHRAGMEKAVETVSALLEGMDLHYYLAMDIQGLKQLIDSLGGVYYTVERPLIGFTPRESLAAGPQMLDGQGYITYLTYREPDTRDDLNRIKRQKTLLRATFAYFQDMGLFRYLIPAYSAYREHIHTDLSFNQIAALALFAAERLEAEAITDYSLQGEYFTTDGGQTYCLRLDEETLSDVLEVMVVKPAQ